MDGKGNDALLKTTRVTEWSINDAGYIPVAFGTFLISGCVVAYVIAVGRGNIDAVLPLISDAAGSPPQNGLFGSLICLGGMFGIAAMIQRYLIILEKNKQNSYLILVINKLALLLGILSMLGIPLITGYPINFYRNREEWMMDVGLPHMIGGVMLFASGLLYIALQCILTLFLKDKAESMLPMRVIFLCLCTAGFVYHMITVPEHFGGVSHLYYLNNSDIDSDTNYTGLLPYPPTLGNSLKLPIDTTGTYVPSAIAQWLFVFFFCCFFFTFFGEAQEFVLCIRIETDSPQDAEPHEDFISKPRPSLIEHPASEVKKLLRRDSTCQTMGDVIEDVVKDSMKPTMKTLTKFSNGATNGSKKALLNADVDTKLARLLNQCESKQEDPDSAKDIVVNGNLSSKKSSTEQEEERTAIEKIDVVVKDAEIAACDSDIMLTDSVSNGKNNNTETYPPVCTLSVQ